MASLQVMAFGETGVKKADAHTVAICDHKTGVVSVIIREHGEYTEVLTPDHPEFIRTVKLLEGAAKVELRTPTDFQVRQ